LHRARTNAELLGDLVQARPIRRSQGGTDAPFQLGVDEGAAAVLATTKPNRTTLLLFKNKNKSFCGFQRE
jgi:hypothetical protein